LKYARPGNVVEEMAGELKGMNIFLLHVFAFRISRIEPKNSALKSVAQERLLELA
jgi:hypothetical protein